MDNFHLKLKDNKKRIPDYPVTRIQEGHYYWFTLSLQSPEYLQELKDFEFQFSAPDTDQERRISEFLASIEDIENKVIILPRKNLEPDEFIIFNFYISLMDCFDDKSMLLILLNYILNVILISLKKSKFDMELLINIIRKGWS